MSILRQITTVQDMLCEELLLDLDLFCTMQEVALGDVLYNENNYAALEIWRDKIC